MLNQGIFFDLVKLWSLPRSMDKQSNSVGEHHSVWLPADTRFGIWVEARIAVTGFAAAEGGMQR